MIESKTIDTTNVCLVQNHVLHNFGSLTFNPLGALGSAISGKMQSVKKESKMIFISHQRSGSKRIVSRWYSFSDHTMNKHFFLNK